MFDLAEAIDPGQSIQIVSPRLGSVAAVMCKLYRDCSTADLPKTWQGYPPTLDPLIKCLLRGQNRNDFLSEPKTWRFPEPAPIQKDKVLLGYSSGKDATAAAIKLRGMGKKVELFYVHGINRAYPGEYEASRTLAALLGMPLHVLEVKVTGKQAWIENPMKNQFILGCMVDFGMRLGFAEYAQGGLECDTIKTQAFGSGYSDSREMFDAATPFLQLVVPEYVYHRGLLKNDTDSLLTVLDKEPTLLPHIHSCMGALRYKKNLVATNERKYGVKLMPHRCGSCYKCALEYLHLVAAGAETYNEGFRNHCYDILITAMSRILGPGKYTKGDVDREFFDNTLIADYIC